MEELVELQLLGRDVGCDLGAVFRVGRMRQLVHGHDALGAIVVPLARAKLVVVENLCCDAVSSRPWC